jgi:hypothetical protein
VVKTISLTANIAPDRYISVALPPDVPLGPADIVVIVAPRAMDEEHTLGDLLASEFFGMWQDRDDIDDSVAFARRLRAAAWQRSE